MRRSIHANPEPAYHEYETARIATKRLEELGYRIQPGIAGSGVIAEIGEGKAVAIRAEMDANCLNELNQVAYRSLKENLMHACGHDAHVAAVVGAAEILARLRTKGKVRIILQPAEESADANGRKGPSHMIEHGALENTAAILGFHVDATMKCGVTGVIARPLIDLQTDFCIAMRHEANSLRDSVELTSKLLHMLIEQKTSTTWRAANLQITEVIANSHAQTSCIRGHYSSDDSNNVQLIQSLNKITSNTLKENFSIEIKSNEDIVAAHKKVLESSFNASNSILGEENTTLIKRRSWTREFSEYAKYVSAAFFLIGSEIPGHRTIQHTASFDIDERCLPVAAAVLAESALLILENT